MRTALITGASAGLGVEFIKAILQHMPEIDNFWLVARRKERLEEIASTLPVGKTANCIAADISCSTGWDILKAELSKAIENENYEEAAVLRDKIRSKEGK